MRKCGKFIITNIKDFLSENKINNLPDVYKNNNYENHNFISEKAHSFLINWCWNEEYLRFYQTNGIDVIDKDIILELSKFKSDKIVELYRAVCDIESETKYNNKLKSYFKSYESALMLLEDMQCVDTGYVESLKVNPENILVDMTTIPNYTELDLISEVIVII